MSSSLKLAVLQLPTLPLSDAKLDYYLQMCYHKGVKAVLIGEYVVNSFFKELEKIPFDMIKEQSNRRIDALKNLSKHYDMTIIAPIVIIKKDKAYKVICKFTPKSQSYHYQKYLINYSHWNEDKFFSNSSEESYDDGVYFNIDGIKIAAVAGFEMHFDELWLKILKRRVDAVFVPMVGTFDSKKRWMELCRVRAFLNGVYIVKANRVGEFVDKKHSWRFYGNSFVIDPNGEVVESLGDKEEVLITTIYKKSASEAKRVWGFRSQLEKKGLI